VRCGGVVCYKVFDNWIDLEKIAILLLTFLPTLYEAWTDRKGERKKDKLIDGALLVGYALLLAFGAWLSGYEWLPVIGFLIVWRVCVFDYLVHWFLKKYSENHGHINIWKYSGKTSKTDRVLSKIDWRVRLWVRAVVIVSSIAF
jgi:hypothetical protein